jgi:radical SAM protein with 4Fe4S-binding SPASM domain
VKKSNESFICVLISKDRNPAVHILTYGEGFVSKRRFFDLPECRNCIYKGSSYCWGQCPYNVWKRDRDY